MLRRRALLKSTNNGNDENCITLLHFDGNANNSSQYPQTWNDSDTMYTQLAFKFGTHSAYDNYAVTQGEYVDFPIATNTSGIYHSYLSSDWTAELWFNMATNVTIYSSALITLSKYSSARAYLDFSLDNTSFTLRHSTNGSTFDYNNTWTIPTSKGVWHHLALVKKDNLLTIYIDGIAKVSNISWAYTPNINWTESVVGRYCFCYLDEFRFSNKARWTANFTPPTAAYA